MKIFKHALCDLIDELEDENGTGRVWINTGFYDDLDPSTCPADKRRRAAWGLAGY